MQLPGPTTSRLWILWRVESGFKSFQVEGRALGDWHDWLPNKDSLASDVGFLLSNFGSESKLRRFWLFQLDWWHDEKIWMNQLPITNYTPHEKFWVKSLVLRKIWNLLCGMHVTICASGEINQFYSCNFTQFSGWSHKSSWLSRFYCNGWWLQATCSLGPSPKEVAGKGKLASAIGVL